MYAQLRVARVSEQRHGAHKRFWFKRDVVVHEQHVCCPTLLTQFNKAASEATSATEVAVWYHLQRCVCGGIEGDVLRVVYDKYAHAATQHINTALKLQHIADGFANVLLTIKRGYRQRQLHIVCWCVCTHPFPARDAHFAALGQHTNEIGTVRS